MIINKKKKTCRIVELAILVDHWKKTKNKTVLGPCQRTRKLWNKRVIVILIIIGAHGAITKRIGKGTGKAGNWMTSRDHPNYSITKPSTETSTGGLKSLVVTQTINPMLVWKSLKEEYNNNYDDEKRKSITKISTTNTANNSKNNIQ